MTVYELIKELNEYPQDIPVIIDLKEVTSVKYDDGCYFLDKLSAAGYSAGPVIVLE